jgi:hypothetical protein
MTDSQNHSRQYAIGDPVSWRHPQRGSDGIGWIPAEVRCVHAETGRATIAVMLEGGETVHRVVMLSSLQRRSL